MSYEYIKRNYPVDPKVGMRVRHDGKLGWISLENYSASHYVQVLFDGNAHPLPCHPTSIEYPIADKYAANATFKEVAT